MDLSNESNFSTFDYVRHFTPSASPYALHSPLFAPPTQLPKVRHLSRLEDIDNKFITKAAVQIELSKPPNDETLLKTIEDAAKSRSEDKMSLNTSMCTRSRVLETLHAFVDLKWPRIHYNAGIEELIVQAMPCPVHEMISTTLLRQFFAKEATYPPQIRDKLSITTGQYENRFSGQYSGSRKTPDFGLYVDDEPRLVLEVGFAEKYEDLIKDARLWIEGRVIKPTVILVKITESPSYRNPLSSLDQNALLRLRLPDPTTIPLSDFDLEQSLGPVSMKGLRWVEQITHAFVEVWQYHAESGLAVRAGDRLNFLENDVLQISLSDFIEIGPDLDDVLTVSAADFQLALQKALKIQARLRFGDASQEKTLHDPDYQP